MNLVRAFVLVALAGCQPLVPVADTSTQDSIAALETKVTDLTDHVATLQRTAAAATSSHEDVATELMEHSRALARVETILATLPDMVKAACPTQTRANQAQCKAQATRVPVSGDKLVLGIREHVLLDPPAANLVARIDTNAAGNYLFVADIVEFQRDGENWVRFTINLPDTEVPVEVERQRARRKAGAEETKDVSVRLRMMLGDVTETYEFTLLKRNARDYQVRLGRSFLKDMALVDVSKRFIQPRPRPDGA